MRLGFSIDPRPGLSEPDQLRLVELVAWSRARLEAAATAAGRPTPVVAEYIRTSVDPDPPAARATLAASALQYALGSPAYRSHFERMGFAEELRRLEAGGDEPGDAFL